MKPEAAPSSSRSGNCPARFWLSLCALALLPMAPEAILSLRNHGDLKALAPVVYYEGIASFIALAPALVPVRLWSRTWVLLAGLLMAMATIVVGFQAVSVGTRWDLVAHTAVMQTNQREATEFLLAFATPLNLAWVIAAAIGFASCIVINLRSPIPRLRTSLITFILCAAASSMGLIHFCRYGTPVRKPVRISTGKTLMICNVGVNFRHPILTLLATSYNYNATHDYYMHLFQQVADHSERSKGGIPVVGATVPRVVVVVIGESASRRHWSLYGYHKETNPELGKLESEILLFSDVISSSVGTQVVLREMFTETSIPMPIFPVFSAAGFKTHWISAQTPQGETDVEVAGLVQSCNHRLFLNAVYDESLVQFMRDAVESPGHQMIFLNLFGSHVRYEDRYPAQYDRFHGDSDKEKLIAKYDNSILYTDRVLAEMIAVLRERHEATCLVYVSDHAEDVYDSIPNMYLFRNDAIATNAMYEVPFLVWFSPEYRSGNPGFVKAAEAARSRGYQTLAFFQSVMDLARLRHPVFDPTLSVFAPEFVQRDRHVGAAGRIYRWDPKR